MLQQEGGSDATVSRKRKGNDSSTQPTKKIGPVAALYNHEGEEEESSIPDCVVPHPDYVQQSLTELRELQSKRVAERVAAENILTT